MLDEFNKAAEKLLNSGMQKLIIDLRDNPRSACSLTMLHITSTKTPL